MSIPPLGRVGRPPRASLLAGVAGAIIAALVVSACSAFDKGTEPPPCPKTSILQDAANITRFVAGSGRDLIDVDFEGKIVDLNGSCNYAKVKDEKGGGPLEVELAITMDLSRGPANRDRRAQLSYFVRLTDAERQVHRGQSFRGVVEFPPNQNRLVWTDDPFTVTIPLEKRADGRNYSIFVGFDLTHDEVEFNRKQLREIRR